MFTEALKKTELHPSITTTFKNIKTHVRNNNDVVVGITGFRGSGKSLLSMIGSYIVNNNSFSIENNMVLVPTVDNIMKALDKTKKYNSLIIDEAIRSMHSMDFMNPATIALSKKFQQERKFNRVVFLNIPDFLELTKAFRKIIHQHSGS